MLARGVHAGFGECLGADTLDLLATWQPDCLRIGIEPDKHPLEAVLDEMIGRPWTPIVCVDLRLAVAPIVAYAQSHLATYILELGNEPNLHDYTPRAYADYVAAQLKDALDLGLPRDRIAVAAIPNCATDTLRWLDAVMGLLSPVDPDRTLLVSFHRYARILAGRQVLALPHTHHHSRAREFDALTTAAHHRGLLCTEFGFDSGARDSRGHDVTMQTDEQARLCARELEWMDAHNVKAAVWYQLNDGPTDQFIDRYGLRAFDGTVKQPIVDALFG